MTILSGPGVAVFQGDCLAVLRSMPDASMHAVVTDPPYGLSKEPDMAEVLRHWLAGDDYVHTGAGFMGKTWDSFVPGPAVWKECFRVLKPGGYLLTFAGSRTMDLMGLAVRLAGFEMRDSIAWLYGSGFPKSMDVSKAIDKVRDDKVRDDKADVRAVCSRLAAERNHAGLTNRQMDEACGLTSGGASASHWTAPPMAKQPRVPTWEQWESLRRVLNVSDPALDAELWRLNGRKGTPGEAWDQREVIGTRTTGIGTGRGAVAYIGDSENRDITAPATPAAQQWSGWGTALKPAFEPIVVARKPLIGTVAANVLEHGTGALNIDGCRVPSSESTRRTNTAEMGYHGGNLAATYQTGSDAGRWPTNVVLDGDAADELDEQSGTLKSGSRSGKRNRPKFGDQYGVFAGSDEAPTVGDSGGASRFFPTFRYQAKAPTKERPVVIHDDGTKTAHPTVKPLALMRWLVRLVTPAGGIVLDPFLGSGTTAQAARDEGFSCVGIERDPDYVRLIAKRLGLEMPATSVKEPTS